MPIYDKATKELMAAWAREHLRPGQEFNKSDPVSWFSKNYPRIKSNTVAMHVKGMTLSFKSFPKP